MPHSFPRTKEFFSLWLTLSEWTMNDNNRCDDWPLSVQMSVEHAKYLFICSSSAHRSHMYLAIYRSTRSRSTLITVCSRTNNNNSCIFVVIVKSSAHRIQMNWNVINLFFSLSFSNTHTHSTMRGSTVSHSFSFVVLPTRLLIALNHVVLSPPATVRNFIRLIRLSIQHSQNAFVFGQWHHHSLTATVTRLITAREKDHIGFCLLYTSRSNAKH